MGKEHIKINVDRELFKSSLRARGLNTTALSTELGYESNWMSNTIGKGYVPQFVASYLEKVYMIPPTEYAPKVIERKVDASVTISRQTVVNGFIDALDKPQVRKYFYDVIKNGMDEWLRSNTFKQLIIEAVKESFE